MLHRLAVCGAIVCAFVVSEAQGAPCAGFTDVDSANSFCPDVAWIQSRAITLGCAAGLYCPNDPVTRLQMAAFLHRLGNITFLQGGNAFGAPAVIGTSDAQPVTMISGGASIGLDVGSGHGLRLSRVTEQDYETTVNSLNGYSGNLIASCNDGTFSCQIAPPPVGATISGGGYSTSGFPFLNQVFDHFGAIGGGAGNTVGTPDLNPAGGGVHATIAGGRGNTAVGENSVIAGGFSNAASGGNSAVGGGFNNRASGPYSTVPGGSDNTASGGSSFAAGAFATADAQGCFVWNDGSTGLPITCGTPGAHRVVMRGTGGFIFITTTDNGVGAQLLPGANAWSSYSDRNYKDHVRAVNARQVLDHLVAMPIATWNWKSQDASIRHMGPMAQDFHAAFGLGENATMINTVDTDGVALAAIQGLNAKLEATLAVRDATIDAQARAIMSLRDELDFLKIALIELQRRTTIAMH